MKVLEMANGETHQKRTVFAGKIDKPWRDWMEVGAGEGEEDTKDEFWISAFKQPFTQKENPEEQRTWRWKINMRE